MENQIDIVKDQLNIIKMHLTGICACASPGACHDNTLKTVENALDGLANHKRGGANV